MSISELPPKTYMVVEDRIRHTAEGPEPYVRFLTTPDEGGFRHFEEDSRSADWFTRADAQVIAAASEGLRAVQGRSAPKHMGYHGSDEHVMAEYARRGPSGMEL